MIINRLQIDVSPGIFEINALIKITFPTLLLALPRSVYSIFIKFYLNKYRNIKYLEKYKEEK